MLSEIVFLAVCIGALNAQAYGGYGNVGNDFSNLKITGVLADGFLAKDANGKFTGFIPDLLDLVAADCNFKYTLSLQADGVYGQVDANGMASGLVGAVQSGNADVGAADLTETSNRLQAVDFTTPVYPSQTRILCNKNDDPTKIHYLVIGDTAIATIGFLQASKNPRDQAIMADINANNGKVANPAEGISKVLAGGFCFVSDTPSLTLAVKANPNKLVLRDDILVERFFAFAVKKESPLRRILDACILHVSESAQLQDLINKWLV